MMRLAALTVLVGSAAHAAPPPDPLAAESIVYARGDALYRSDAKGRGEALLAKLPAKADVRALRGDAAGKALLVDVGGAWSWMPLDGGKPLAPLPCAKDGPAQLSQDGTEVVCRSPKVWGESIIVTLATGAAAPVAVGSRGARIVGRGADRRLVWADAHGVYAAPPGKLADKKQVAPFAPWTNFLPSPDGARAIGIYTESVRKEKQIDQGDQLVGFALDGVGARRKGLPRGVPVEWSHDGQWILVQDADSACILRALGGQYKCWKGFHGAGLAPDGSYALLIGPAKGGTPVAPTTSATDDLAFAPPPASLPLWRGVLNGPNNAPPTQVTATVDGAAVWLGK
ncbi:MAG: hypothetical protein KIT31_06170 [Deltaproteobacteria bacterium]|nr:hypothetical protein [Deltaproteobacteria bacterium]